MNQNTFYPVMLNLKGKRCVVVGGGEVACRKVKQLVNCGARVIVISPTLIPQLEKMKEEGKITHFVREYRKGDLKDSFLVIGATGKKGVNKEVAREAREVKALVNIVDSPLLCDFFVPSILRRGKLTISISTDGTSPALAKKIKTELEKVYGEEYAEFLDWMEKARSEIIKNIKNENERKKIFNRLIESGVLDLLKRGKQKKAREYFLELIKEESKCK